MFKGLFFCYLRTKVRHLKTVRATKRRHESIDEPTITLANEKEQFIFF